MCYLKILRGKNSVWRAWYVTRMTKVSGFLIIRFKVYEIENIKRRSGELSSDFILEDDFKELCSISQVFDIIWMYIMNVHCKWTPSTAHVQSLNIKNRWICISLCPYITIPKPNPYNCGRTWKLTLNPSSSNWSFFFREFRQTGGQSLTWACYNLVTCDRRSASGVISLIMTYTGVI